MGPYRSSTDNGWIDWQVVMIRRKNQKPINAETISDFTFEDAMALVGTPVEELV